MSQRRRGVCPVSHGFKPSLAAILSPGIGVLLAVGACVPITVVIEAAEQPFLELHPADTPPVIDGRLDDGCWQSAPAITNFTQVLPEPETAPTELTAVRFVYTRDYLYVGIRCSDSEADRIIAKEMLHDGDFGSDDHVKLAVDTFNRQRDGYFFSVNPAGVRVEGLIGNFDQQNTLWDGIWQARARLDDEGWTAEMAIPFKSLSFDPQSDIWGCNVQRVIRRKQEVVRWTSLSPAKDVTSLADFGQLRGLRELRQGLGLEARPFLSVSYHDDREPRDRGWDAKPGLDITYRIRPSLTAQGTFNTDFAEAEVDERQVNLTRFPLFFPEKRDFFLQDAALFDYGGIGTTPLPYYSRRIGLAPDGTPVDIVAGGRLTGRIGGTSIALLDVQQKAYDEVPSKNLAVARVSQQVWEESNLGLIATHGDPQAKGDNTLAGVDFNYLNRRLADERQLVGHGFFMGTSSERFDGEDVAFGGDLDYPNEPLDIHLFFRQIGERFDPALGFVSRRGVRAYYSSARYLWRPNGKLIRTVAVGASPDFVTDLDNHLVEEDIDFPFASLTTPSGDLLYAEYSLNSDVLEEPFEIWPGVVVPAGDYGWGSTRVTLSSSEARPVSVYASFREATYYTGTRRDYYAGSEWRPSRYVTGGLSYELRQVRLCEGDFDVRLAGLRLRVALTPDLSWLNMVQYDNSSELVGWFSRVRWTFRPGSDLFLVLNQGYRFDDWSLSRHSTQVTVKAGATFRF